MDFLNLMKQAEAMSKNLEETNNKLNAMEFEGSASNGLVKIYMTGEYKTHLVKIDESILNKEDKEMIEELVMIAFNDACNKIKESRKEGLDSLTGMLGM